MRVLFCLGSGWRSDTFFLGERLYSASERLLAEDDMREYGERMSAARKL